MQAAINEGLHGVYATNHPGITITVSVNRTEYPVLNEDVHSCSARRLLKDRCMSPAHQPQCSGDSSVTILRLKFEMGRYGLYSIKPKQVNFLSFFFFLFFFFGTE